MPAFFPPSYTLFIIAVMALLVFGALAIQSGWRRYRKLAVGFFGVLLAGVAMWLYGYAWEGCAIAYTGILVFFPAAVLLPAIALADRRLVRRAASSAPARGITVSRRALLAMPVATAATSVSGFAQAS